MKIDLGDEKSTKPIKKGGIPVRILTVLILSVTLVIIGTVIGIYTTQKPEQSVNVTPTPTPTQAEAEPSGTPTPSPTSLPRRVAYITDNDLWTISLDGTHKEKIAAVTLPTQGVVTSLFWKNASTVSYAACTPQKKCTVYDVLIIQKQINPVATDISGEKLFGAWANNTQLLLGIQNQGTSSGSVNDSISIRNGSSPVATLKGVSASGVFLDGYKDDIFRISKLLNGSQVVAHDVRAGNSGIDYNDNTFVIENGRIIATAKSSSAALLSQSKLAVIYRDTLEVKDITKNESTSYQIVFGLDETLFQLRAAADGNRVSFWTPAKTKSITFMYDISRKERTLLHEQFVPEYGWVTDSLILGRSTLAQSSDYRVNTGLALLNVTTKELKGLVNEAVSIYSVE
ncbi:MAG: hypothetical protein QY314_03375 [Candidatus Dojkabacteria bacterium]|nr:MAG: hypothetical protein QY314_03375 [Candidatus Dojkabacteria bacterium]